ARGGGIFLLSRDADDGGRVRLRPDEEFWPDGRQQLAARGGRLRDVVRRRLFRGQEAARLRDQPRLLAVRLVAHRRRRAWADRPRAVQLEHRPHPEERSAGPRLEGWHVHRSRSGPWFETRSHSASQTRVNALKAALLTTRSVMLCYATRP